MADDLDFDSFEQMDDLDWSELEQNAEGGEGEAAAAAPEEPAAEPAGGGEAEPAPAAAAAPGGGAGDANAAKLAAGARYVDINYLLDVNLHLTVEVGRKQAYISSVLGYDHGSIVELEKQVGEPLDLLVNNKRVARGEVVVVNEKFALKITEILDPNDRLAQIM